MRRFLLCGLFLTLLISCGEEPASVVLDLEAVSGPPVPQGSLSDHLHRVVIPSIDIQDPLIQQTYSTTASGSPQHQHTLTLFEADFRDLAAGRALFLSSSKELLEAQEHEHAFLLTP